MEYKYKATILAIPNIRPINDLMGDINKNMTSLTGQKHKVIVKVPIFSLMVTLQKPMTVIERIKLMSVLKETISETNSYMEADGLGNETLKDYEIEIKQI